MSVVTGWLLLVLHAVAMPVQYDEAVTVLRMADGGPLSAFTRYADGTNNHPLLSLLVGLMMNAGVTDIVALRVPSLVAGLAVLLAASRLVGSARPAAQALVPLALAATPLFHDYLVMARGYSLGLACLLCGVLAFRRSAVGSGLLLGLSAVCVPTYAADVAAAAAAQVWTGQPVRRVMTAVAVGAGLSAAAYALILPDVVSAALSLSGESKFAAVMSFVSALSGYGLTAGAVTVAAAVAAACIGRGRGFAPCALLVSLPLVSVGYPRTHLFTAVLLVVTLVTAAATSRRAVVFLVFALAASLTVLPWDRIASEPDTWPVTGFSVARGFVPCLSVQKRVAFVVPHAYYERLHDGQPFDADCPFFLMVRDDSLGIPPDLRLFQQALLPYGVELYRRDDLESLLR